MKKLLLIAAFFSIETYAKVLIITHNYNRPDFIEMQYKTFKKFLNDDYEYVVFNDARNNNSKEQIDAMCARYGIRCIRIPQEIHARPYLPRNPGDDYNQANIRHANCCQYSMDVLGFDHDGIVCIFDADLFPIRPFSITEYMKDKDIAAMILPPRGGKIYYICPIISMFAMHKLPDKKTINFNPGMINNVTADSGGSTYHYLVKHPALKVKHINVLYSHQLFLGDSHVFVQPNTTVPEDVKRSVYERLGFNTTEIEFFLKQPNTFEFYEDHHFIHYRGGTNHTNDSVASFANKNKIFEEFLLKVLQS